MGKSVCRENMARHSFLSAQNTSEGLLTQHQKAVRIICWKWRFMLQMIPVILRIKEKKLMSRLQSNK
jgi:hypothetical protein